MVKLIAKTLALAAGASTQTGADGTPNIASLGSPSIGYPRDLTVAVSVSAATTITVFVSYDGATWVAASVIGTATAASLTFSGAGGQAIKITPAPYVQLTSSAAATISAWAYTS